MYFAALQEDPLYLFTRTSLEICLAGFLDEILRPVLEYMQELYGPPIRLDGLPIMDYPCAELNQDEIIVRAKNFVYDRRSYEFRSCHIWQVLNAITPDAVLVKKGVTTILTVHIPKRWDDPFWYHTFTESEEKLFGWNISEDALSFQVTQWGPLEEYSKFYATQRAKDIIRHIRAAVSRPNYVPLRTPRAMMQESNSHAFSCPVLRLGIDLNDTWRRADSAFSTICSEEFMKYAIEIIQKWIDSEAYTHLSPVLRFYQVYPFGFDLS